MYYVYYVKLCFMVASLCDNDDAVVYVESRPLCLLNLKLYAINKVALIWWNLFNMKISFNFFVSGVWDLRFTLYILT